MAGHRGYRRRARRAGRRAAGAGPAAAAGRHRRGVPARARRQARRGRRRGRPGRRRGADRRFRRDQGAPAGFPRAVTRAVTLSVMDSHAQASVDLETITDNVAALGAHVAPSAVMAVVKAGGYGHGAVAAARAALRGGAQWLGVAHVAEALELRAAGIDGPLLCLMAI